jgi:hypothetical protein
MYARARDPRETTAPGIRCLERLCMPCSCDEDEVRMLRMVIASLGDPPASLQASRFLSSNPLVITSVLSL